MDNRIPYLRKQGSATQLMVDGKPFLVLGGELHNSSSSDLAFMEPIWGRMVDLNMNTVLLPVYWELVEPEEGHFDFALVDGLLDGARRHGLKLILLWFGSWKNGMSSYVPAWVKRDTARFPRISIGDDTTIEVLSTLAPESSEADARAFAALMRHLRAVDAGEHTVIMVQVENEVGVLGDTRDRSGMATRAFQGSVPDQLLGYLEANRAQLGPEIRERWESAGARTAGSWEEVFGAGAETDAIFMAWHYATYVDTVAAAGKAEYPLPMFVNAWLSADTQLPGEFPSGGPLPQVMDIWRAAIKHIDLLTPDIYQVNFEEWCRRYTRHGSPLFIPEMRRDADGARNVWYAIGQHDAIGTSPFAVDSLVEPSDTPLAQSYAVLRQIAPLILEHQGATAMAGFLLDGEQPSVTREIGGYELTISLDEVFHLKAEIGYGLVIAVGPDTFVGAGSGFRVAFRPLDAGPRSAGIVAVDEGVYREGQWVAGRRLNGDENDQGRMWRFSPQGITIERCSVYRY
jgi:beta-galactosidase GanA